MDVDNYNQLLSVLNSLNNPSNYDSYKSNLKWLEDYQKTVNFNIYCLYSINYYVFCINLLYEIIDFIIIIYNLNYNKLG